MPKRNDGQTFRPAPAKDTRTPEQIAAEAEMKRLAALPQYKLGEDMQRAPGVEVFLNGSIFHAAIFTAVGGVTFNHWFTEQVKSLSLLVDGPTIGTTIMIALQIQPAGFRVLREFLARGLAEDVPENLEYLATAGDLARAIDVIIEAAGIRWMADIIKNSVAAATEQIVAGLSIAARSDREMNLPEAIAMVAAEQIRQVSGTASA